MVGKCQEWFGKIQWNIVKRKRRFYNLLNMEDITDADYTHRERLCEDLN